MNIGAIVSEMTGIPHVWHLRELGNLDFSLAPASKRYSMERVINSGNSFYIAISECIEKYYGKDIKDNSKISVIYNGISSSYNYRKSESE